MEDCIFCKIARGEIPSNKVYEDDEVIAFNDLNPQAPVHVLIVPKAHFANLNEADDMSEALLAHLLRTASHVAKRLGLDKSGYRVVSNCGADACQSVQHLHIHLLGGAKLAENTRLAANLLLTRKQKRSIISLVRPYGARDERRGGIQVSEVRIRENESLESALRRFKRQCARAGVLAEVRKREHYEKPSVKRKKKAEAARKRKY